VSGAMEVKNLPERLPNNSFEQLDRHMMMSIEEAMVIQLGAGPRHWS